MATTTTATTAPPVPTDDRMPVHGIDHVELYVGNAAQAAYYFRNAFGFAETAYAGLETGRRDRVSHVLEQGRIRLVLTGTLLGGDDIAAHHAPPRRRRPQDRAERARRGGGLRARRGRTARAAIMTPHWVEDEHGRVQLSSIATYGETQHLFVQREGYEGAFLPGYERAARPSTNPADMRPVRDRPHRRQRRARPHGGVGATTTSASSA